MSTLGGALPPVNTDPVTMPIAVPARARARARAATAVEQYKSLPWQEMREGLVLEAKLAKQSLLVPVDEEQKRLARNRLPTSSRPC